MKETRRRVPVVEGNGTLQPAGTIFNSTIHGDLRVPSEVRKAGLLVAGTRDVLDVSRGTLAPLVGIGTTTLRAFELGRRNTELAPVYDAMSQYLYERDATMEQLERLRNNQQWFRTFTLPGMTTGDHVELMCLSGWNTPRALASKAGIAHVKSITNFMNDKRRPFASTFNAIIEASAVDPDSKAAQVARLQRSGQQPKKLSEFGTDPVGKIARYLREVYGLTAEELGEKIHYSKSAVLLFEKGKRTMTKEIIDAYAQWLGLSDNSPLLWSLRFKAAYPEEPFPDKVLPFVFEEERLLFQEHVDQVREYPLTPEDRELLSELKPLSTTSAKLLHIKQKYKLPIRPKVMINGKPTVVAIDNITTEGRIATGLNIAKAMLVTGRDIHNPVTHHVLKSAKSERMAQVIKINQRRKRTQAVAAEQDAA